MKKSMLLTSLLLSSVLLLGGCNQSRSSSTATSASSSSSQSVSASSTESSSTSASSGNAEQTTEKSGEQVNSSNSGETGTETQTNAGTQSTPAGASSILSDSIANGDFSSIVGTWSNSEGKVLTVEANGVARFADSNEVFTISVHSVKDSVIHADIASGAYSAAMKIIPAGVEDPYYATVEDNDRIATGHGIDMYDHPFYRQ